mgnify:CR=1 FL=1
MLFDGSNLLDESNLFGPIEMDILLSFDDEISL